MLTARLFDAKVRAGDIVLLGEDEGERERRIREHTGNDPRMGAAHAIEHKKEPT